MRLSHHIKYRGRDLEIEIDRYPHDGAICVVLYDNGEPPYGPWGIFSKNLRSWGAEISNSEFHVDENNMGKEVTQLMLKTGLFTDTGRWDKSGFCMYPVWKVNSPSNIPPVRKK